MSQTYNNIRIKWKESLNFKSPWEGQLINGSFIFLSQYNENTKIYVFTLDSVIKLLSYKAAWVEHRYSDLLIHLSPQAIAGINLIC